MAIQPKTKSQRLYYRRANFGNLKINVSLESLLLASLSNTSNVGERTFMASGGAEIRCSRYEHNNGLYLQLSTYTPDQPTSTIESDKTSFHSDIEEHDAPNGKHFVDGELFLYVNENAVILCPSAGAREKHADAYFKKLLEQANFDAEAGNLELDKVAKASKIDLIMKEGVKEIMMDCSLYDASIMRLTNRTKKVNEIKGVIVEQFRSIFAHDMSLKDINERENLNMKISFSFDGHQARLKDNKKIVGFGDQGRKRLALAAEMLLDESDDDGMEGFKILTNKDKLITASEIRVSDTRRILTFGKSLSKNDAWVKLSGYHAQLKHDGILTQ